MSGDRYSGESAVCNLLHDYLSEGSTHILQLVYPGAQAGLSIRFQPREDSPKKLIFPDLLAIKDDAIWIGEIKADFSSDDYSKLVELRESTDGNFKINELVARITKSDRNDRKVLYFLIHGQETAVAVEKVGQLVMLAERCIIVDSLPDS